MKKKKSSFRDKVSADSSRQKKQGSSYGYLNLVNGITLFKEEARSRISLDFLPYKVTDENHLDRNDDLGIAIPGELWYKKPFYIHRNIGVNNDSIVCPTTIGKRCPICEYRAKRVKEGADKEELGMLRTSLRNLYTVIPLEDKNYKEQPYLWDISQYLFQNLLNDEIEEDPDTGIFPDLEEGLTLKLRFSEASIGKNKFAQTSRIDFKERSEAYTEKILEKVPNLDDCLTIYPYAKLEKLFLEIEDEKEEEEKKEAATSVTEVERDKGTYKRKKEDIKEDVTESEESDEQQRSIRRKKRHSKEKEKEEKENPCSYGHTFGKDCDKYDDCKECEKWDDCIDASDEE